ncbi:hypothetical protein D9M72_508860 [compost metagenome]
MVLQGDGNARYLSASSKESMHLRDRKSNRMTCGDFSCNVHCDTRTCVHINHRFEFRKVFFKVH